MVRSEITINDLDGAWNARETPDAIDVGNDHNLAGADAYRYIVILVHISAGTGTGGDIELVEGDAAPAFLRDQGGLAIGDNLVAEEEYVLGPVETARFLQSDGSIHLDVTNTSNTDLAGTIEAYGIE